MDEVKALCELRVLYGERSFPEKAQKLKLND